MIEGEPSAPAWTGAVCPACGSPLDPPVLDLGDIPQATLFPMPDDPLTADPRWALTVHLCDSCGLLHLAPTAPDEAEAIELTGLAALSTTLSDHARRRASELVARFDLGPGSTVLERSSHGNHAPAAFTEHGLAVVTMAGGSAATALRARRHPVVESPSEVPEASVDLIVDDYALAHDRDPVGLLTALAARLTSGGVICAEFDDLGSIVRGTQFDAFRHGHHLYLSAASLAGIAERAGLRLLSVAEATLHGGAGLAVLVRREDRRPTEESARSAVEGATDAGLADRVTYAAFGLSIESLAAALLDHLRTARSADLTVLGYGAPSRAVTLANRVGIGPDLVAFTVDRSPAKHGRSIPGVRLPIAPVERLAVDPPDELLLFAWPLVDEIRAQLPWLSSSQTRLLRPLPRVELLGSNL